MGKIFKTIAALLGAAILLVSCSSGGSGGLGNGGGKGDYTVYLLDKPTTGDWGIWYWLITTSGTEIGVSGENGAWPTGATSITGEDSIGSFQKLDIPNIDNYSKLGLLFVNRSKGSEQTSDVLVPISELKTYKTLYFTFSNPKVYYTSLEDAVGIMSGQITNKDGTEITVNTSRLSAIDSTKISVKDSDGTEFTVKSATLNASSNKAVITLSSGNIQKTPYTVTYENKTITVSLQADLLDEIFKYDSDDLGLSLSGTTAAFKVWAPIASKVQLALYADSTKVSDDKNATLTEMQYDSATGVWAVANVDVQNYKYYKYAITNAGITNYVADINHNVASANSVASQIASIDDTEAKPDSWESDYKNPFGNTGTDTKKYSDAVIYEMHVRDWSRAEVSDSTGKYLDIANGSKVIAHLKDLGVTHVQLLPVFDYAEKNADSNYNWGYNPYHYNVPEGRYVSANYTDGTQAVKELRTLVQKLHEANIAVIMDVVYNHTNGTGTNSLYDMTVPEYFYRMNSDGSYSNGSGCGNEVATNHAMVKKYVINSLKHWMTNYHINGFRFDLMGCLEESTMADIYDALYAIDKNVLVYGEPWTGGTSAVVGGAAAAGVAKTGYGYGAFDDDYRDAIKGAEFGGFKQGYVQGVNNSAKIITGLTGGETTRNKTKLPELTLHYAECHDNYTLFDKLSISLNGGTSSAKWQALDKFSSADQTLLKNEDTLAAAFVLLAQGTPFLNGGQEFLRTKQGDENSYKSSDTINQISLEMKTTNATVYNTYKGLIALRKANADAFGNTKDAKAEVYNNNNFVIKYTTGNFCVYFNASSSPASITTTDYTKVIDVTSGTPTEGTSLPSTVGAKSFVILKKS